MGQTRNQILKKWRLRRITRAQAVAMLAQLAVAMLAQLAVSR